MFLCGSAVFELQYRKDGLLRAYLRYLDTVYNKTLICVESEMFVALTIFFCS